MSEEENTEETPLESPSPDDFASPLRTILTEIHEVYEELIKIGFPEKTATMVIAHMIQDAMLYRAYEDDDSDDDEFNDDDESSDDLNDRGFE